MVQAKKLRHIRPDVAGEFLWTSRTFRFAFFLLSTLLHFSFSLKTHKLAMSGLISSAVDSIRGTGKSKLLRKSPDDGQSPSSPPHPQAACSVACVSSRRHLCSPNSSSTRKEGSIQGYERSRTLVGIFPRTFPSLSFTSIGAHTDPLDV